MKHFIILSGILLSLLGYGTSVGGGSGNSVGFMDGMAQSRALLIWALGFFGSVTAIGLTIAMVTEKRRVKRELAAHKLSLEKFQRSIRKDLVEKH